MKKGIMVFFFLATFPAFAGNNAANRLQATINQIRTMSANFSQTVRDGQRVIQKSAGTMSLQRPGRFRWQARRPNQQLVVSNGKTLWVYDKDLAQVTVQPISKAVASSPAFFLSGYNRKIAGDFRVRMNVRGNKSYYTLTPINRRVAFRYIQMSFTGNALTWIRLKDKLGQTTDMHLSRVKVNPRLRSGSFYFKPPRGVDVVRLR